MKSISLEKLLHKAIERSIEELSIRWVVYVLQDIDIRYFKDNEYRYDEWHDLRIKIANELVPKDKEEVHRLAKESSLQSLGVIDLVDDKYLLKTKNNPFAKGVSLRKMLCDLVVDHLLDPKEERYILALTLDKISKKISEDYEQNRFSDESYFIELMNEKNIGFPILFANQNVRDNPFVMKLAFDKKPWLFDMSSQRLRELSKNQSPEEVLKKDMLRKDLESSLVERKELNCVNKTKI